MAADSDLNCEFLVGSETCCYCHFTIVIHLYAGLVIMMISCCEVLVLVRPQFVLNIFQAVIHMIPVGRDTDWWFESEHVSVTQ